MIDTEKTKALEQALKNIEKNMKITVCRIKDMENNSTTVESIPSGSLMLDYALGVKGYPRGRVIEIYGKPSSGKTLLSLLAIAEAQKMGGTAAFVDVEHAFDSNWAKKLGVDVDNLVFNQPDYGEQALEVVENLASSNAVDIIVVDSTAALIPKAELEGSLEDQNIALQARMMSKAMRRLIGCVGKSKTVIIFVNQVRQNPMVMFGNPETTPGGEALKFYSSVRMSVNKVSSSEIKNGTEVLGHKVHVKVVKNKVGPPLREATLTLYFSTGVDSDAEIVDLALQKNIIEQKGPSYIYKVGEVEKGKWFGVEKFKDALKQDRVLFDEIKKACLA